MRHLHSPITTVLEAARLVRHLVELRVDTFNDPAEFDDLTLLGACGVSSFCLWQILLALEVDSSLVLGRFTKAGRDRGFHCWVETGDIIVDVTATQFDIPSPVHVTSKNDSRYSEITRNGGALKHLTTWDNQGIEANMSQLQIIIDDVKDDLAGCGFVRLSKAA